MKIHKVKISVCLCLAISFAILSCSRRNSLKAKETYIMKPEYADTCLIDNVRNGTVPSDMDSSEVKITTWGIRFVGDERFGIKDNSVGLPNIPELYTGKQWAYCHNDSCNSGYNVIGLRCPKDLHVKRWVNAQIWKEMKENGNKKAQKLFIANASVSDKQIVDFYLKDWRKDYDLYLNHQLICQHISDCAKSPTEQFGLFIVDVWKHRNYYTMCVHNWYDMLSCGCNSRTSFYTISCTNGKVLKLRDIISPKDRSKIEPLLRRKLAWIRYKSGNYYMQDISYIDNISGVAFVEEGLLVYFLPYTIGYGYEGQYNIVLPYKQLKENGIQLVCAI